MTSQPDLFGSTPKNSKQLAERVSIEARAVEVRRTALLLETPDLPPKRAWVPAPPVVADPDHDGFFILPRKMAIEKGLM